jgi:uncharacterized membrane protein YdjX (TVP38/TMEM64 family)
MKRYWMISIALAGFFLLLFIIVEAMQIPILVDPSERLMRGGAMAAVVGVSLLVADVVLPVPSSLVMIAHGALFGVVTGSLLSLAGMIGAAMVGFSIGRRGERLLKRFVSEAERRRVNAMLDRWGALAIVITRPVPILAETCAILAGASPISWTKALVASIAGSLPPALLYALTGSVSASFQSGALMFLFVLLVSGSFWLISYRLRSSREGKDVPARSQSDQAG